MDGKVEGVNADHAMRNRLRAAQSWGGRLGLRAGVLWKQLCWRCSVRCPGLVKRGFDVGGSLVLILLLSPVFMAAAVCIKLEDGGSALAPGDAAAQGPGSGDLPPGRIFGASGMGSVLGRVGTVRVRSRKEIIVCRST